MIKAEIIADSQAPTGARITTFRLMYPRFIHSELMTHRAFSRNAASSRAIPLERMIQMLVEHPARPVKWGSKQPGMQSGAEVTPILQAEAVTIWARAQQTAIAYARALDEIGIHKSISNRLLEPFAHMLTVVTATEWHNFFALRAHPDAQPEFQELAYQMLDLYLDNKPAQNSGWHLPFIDETTLGMDLPTDTLIRMCVARCARTSYMKFKTSSVAEDLELHDKLMNSGHWSPFEHPAFPTPDAKDKRGNFVGWRQYRKHFTDENHASADLHEIRGRRNLAK